MYVYKLYYIYMCVCIYKQTELKSKKQMRQNIYLNKKQTSFFIIYKYFSTLQMLLQYELNINF